MNGTVRSRRAILAAFVSLAFFALNPVFVAYLPLAFSFWTLLFWSLIIASVFLAVSISLFYRSEFVAFVKGASPAAWVGILLTSILRTLVSLCFFFAITEASKIEATVLTLMWPIFFVLLSVAFDSYRPRALDIVMVLLAFVGAAIIVLGSRFPFGFTNLNIGLVMAVVAAFLGGVHSLVYKRVFSSMKIDDGLSNQVVMIFFRSIIGTAFLAIGFIAVDAQPLVIPETVTSALYLLGLGVLSYAGTQVLYCYALMKIDPVELSGIQYFNPIIVTFFIAVFVGEAVTDSFLIGAVVVFASQYLLQFRSAYMTAEKTAIFLGIPVIILIYYFNNDGVTFFRSDSFLVHTEAPALIGTVFAVLVSFALNRIMTKNRLLDQRQMEIYGLVATLSRARISQKTRAKIEGFVHAMVDLDWLYASKDRLAHLDRLEDSLDELVVDFRSRKSTAQSIKSTIDELEAMVRNWALLRTASSPVGETMGIWILGILALVSLTALSGGGFVKDLVVLLFSLAILYICALALDVERNHNGRNFEGFYFVLNSLKRMGFEPYIPHKIVENKRLPEIQTPITFITTNESGQTVQDTIEPATVRMKIVQVSLILAVLVAIVWAFALKHAIL